MRFNRRKPPLGAPGRPEGRRAGAGRGQAGRRGRLSAGRTVRAVRAAAAGAGAAGSGGAGGRRGGGTAGPGGGCKFCPPSTACGGGGAGESLWGSPPPSPAGAGGGQPGAGREKGDGAWRSGVYFGNTLRRVCLSGVAPHRDPRRAGWACGEGVGVRAWLWGGSAGNPKRNCCLEFGVLKSSGGGGVYLPFTSFKSSSWLRGWKERFLNPDLARVPVETARW